MKRRTFIWLAGAALVGAAIPYGYRKYRHSQLNSEPLLWPRSLSNFCDEDIVRDIGRQYRRDKPAENNEAGLRHLLLTDDKGHSFSSSDPQQLEGFLEKKVKQNFASNDIVVVKGWVLSLTEGRQCALFSLT